MSAADDPTDEDDLDLPPDRLARLGPAEVSRRTSDAANRFRKLLDLNAPDALLRNELRILRALLDRFEQTLK